MSFSISQFNVEVLCNSVEIVTSYEQFCSELIVETDVPNPLQAVMEWNGNYVEIAPVRTIPGTPGTVVYQPVEYLRLLQQYFQPYSGNCSLSELLLFYGIRFTTNVATKTQHWEFTGGRLITLLKYIESHAVSKGNISITCSITGSFIVQDLYNEYLIGSYAKEMQSRGGTRVQATEWINEYPGKGEIYLYTSRGIEAKKFEYAEGMGYGVLRIPMYDQYSIDDAETIVRCQFYKHLMSSDVLHTVPTANSILAIGGCVTVLGKRMVISGLRVVPRLDDSSVTEVILCAPYKSIFV